MTTKMNEEFEHRPYQQAIIQRSIERNSIVFLPTGAGKSYIAVQVIKHFSKDLERKYSDRGKISVFLVTTVCLAKQQAENIASMVTYQVSVLCGEQKVEYWKADEWNAILDNNQILVATAQVILDAIKRSYIKKEQINVLVFDECHHGRSDHAYHEIIKMYKNDSIKDTRVIGLSGMLIGNDKKIEPALVRKELEKLERNFQSTIITVNNIDDHQNALLCSTNAEEFSLKFVSEPRGECVEEISSMLKVMREKLLPIKLANYVTIDPKSLRPTTPKKIKNLILMFENFNVLSSELGPFGGYLCLLSNLIQFELIKRWSDTESYRTIIKSCITLTEACINKMENDLGLSRDDPQTILEHSSDKVKKLFLLLQRTFTDPKREKNLQCLVFVKQKTTAKVLYHALKAYANHNADFPIVPDFMVGINQGMPESIESILSNNYNSITLEKFKNMETNLIVSTSVLEEGIDLQACNLVIMFDPPATFRSYIQSRGRGRVNNSKYVVLVNNTDFFDFNKKVENWRSVNEEMKEQLLMKTLDREPPSEEDILREQEEVWTPFITPISKSILNNLNSVSLLNLYAGKMPADRFTNVNVLWRRIDDEETGTVVAAIQLPLQSTIRDEIFSDPQPNVRLAKQHAAFKACVRLYEAGELNDNLVPIDEKQKIEMHNEEYFSHWEKYSEDRKTAGTRNNRRYHQIQTSDLLEDSAPKVGECNFLYAIHVRPSPKLDTSKKAIKVFSKLLGNEKCFGILTSKRIPKLCKMPLFQSFGEIEVEISSVPHHIDKLNTEMDLNVLRRFHIAIFRDVLKTWQNYFAFDKSSYLIVPLTDFKIDWDFAREFQRVEKPIELSPEQVESTSFSEENYLHRVINPVYRETEQNYVVIEVHKEMSPLSPFDPKPEYEHYKEYVEYTRRLKNGKILNLKQPLIEVKGISQNLNLFFPGAGTAGKQRKHEKEDATEIYIPEICHNYKFPADYWLKATLLPSICHRIHYLLHAEKLRKWLIDEGIDQGNGRQVYKLDVDYGSYDKRDKSEHEREESSIGHYPNLEELKNLIELQGSSNAVSKVRHTSGMLVWDKEELPLDIDRNWLTVTEVDLIKYYTFLNTYQNQISPASLSRLHELTRSPPRRGHALMDDEMRGNIAILTINPAEASVQQKDLLKVITTSNAGDVFDMERFEVLGDAFLKFITSLFLYKTYEDWHEGYLTTLKGKIVSNRNLFYVGNEFGLSEIIKSSKFDAKQCLPQSICLPKNVHETLVNDKTLLSKLSDIRVPLSDEEVLSSQMRSLKIFEANSKPRLDFGGVVVDDFLTYINQHFVGDKIVADAVEALLGVVVQSVGIEAGVKLCHKLQILPQKESSSQLLTEKIAPRFVIKNASERDLQRIPNSQELERIIGYKFKQPAYLVQALTHASYPIKVMGSYQQLEFLGDAVLDFLVTSFIIENCPKMDPGKLTDLRSALVNNVTLACIIVRNGIHKFLLSENRLLSESMKRFADYQKSNDHQVVLDQIILLETEEDTSAAEAVDVPKVIGDIFESIVGAIFLDSGLDLIKTWSVIYGLMKHEIAAFMADVPLQIIRRLFEYEKGSAEPKFYKSIEVNEESVGVPLEIYCGVDEKGCRLKKVFVGIGKNQTLAKKCAAKLALRALKK